MTEHAKDTLCRNVTIYGKCRYEDKGELSVVAYLKNAEMSKAVLSITKSKKHHLSMAPWTGTNKCRLITMD